MPGLNVPVRSLHIKTFGCQMNVYDSDRMVSLLRAQGYRVEPDLRRADVILLNTCSIRDKAEQKVLSLLGELKPLKDAKPSTVIGVSGCVGQRMGRKLLQKVPHLDLVFGPDSVDRVGQLLDAVIKDGQRLVEAKFDTQPGAAGTGIARTYSQPAATFAEEHRARPAEFLTIMKGCDHFCTYCIVPFVRGREKSRPIAEILEDSRRYVARGAKEITFLGQNINTYGKGTPERLSQLIEEASRIEGLERIRYITSHPRDLGEDLMAQFGHVDKLCPALHLPFQSGSDRVLKKMSRLYTRDEYLRKIERLRHHCPDIALSTDVIVGFPGETEADFAATLDLLRTVDFAHAFLFKYSPRPGTRAVDLGLEEVPENVKDERLYRAQAVAFPAIERDNLRYVGRTIACLIEKRDKKGSCYSGRTPHNKLVHVKNAGEACVGKIIDVEICDANGTNLKGYYVGAPRTDRDLCGESVSAPRA